MHADPEAWERALCRAQSMLNRYAAVRSAFLAYLSPSSLPTRDGVHPEPEAWERVLEQLLPLVVGLER